VELFRNDRTLTEDNIMRLVMVALGIAMMVISLAITATGIAEAAGKTKTRPTSGTSGFKQETVEQCRARLMAAGTFQSHQRGYCVGRGT
jgi:hypothetical protein